METKRQHICCVALLVREYEAAKAYYCGVLGFELIEDTILPDGKRWVLVAPPGSSETRLLLTKAGTPVQAAGIGNQGGGRVFLFLNTDDFWRDFQAMRAKGVHFCEEPRKEATARLLCGKTCMAIAGISSNWFDWFCQKSRSPGN